VIIKFNNYINEGVRDKMTPKSEEEIINSLKGLDSYQRIYKAIQHGILSVVKETIEEGIDLTKNVGGGTSAGQDFAYHAVEHGKKEVLEYLLNNGCDLGGMEDYQLGIAIDKGHYDVAKFLVDRGADINDKEGDSYLERAVEYDNLELVKLVINCGCEWFGNDWFNDILLNDETKTEIIKYMMENISDVKEFVEKMYRDYQEGVKLLSKYV
jgi:hypothetical protein